MGVSTGEISRDTEKMTDRKVTSEGVKIDTEMTTTTTEEIRADTEMMIDKTPTSDGVKTGTGKVSDKTTTGGESRRGRVREHREVPRTITTNFRDQKRTPRTSTRVTRPPR